MTAFVDTSALLAVLDADDEYHLEAKIKWQDLLVHEAVLVTTNYVLVETFALVQHRLGTAAVRALQEDVVPLLAVEWVDESAHQAGVTGVLSAGRKKYSIVDCVSFDIMRRLGIKSAFAFDRHFPEQGFLCVP